MVRVLGLLRFQYLRKNFVLDSVDFAWRKHTPQKREDWIDHKRKAGKACYEISMSLCASCTRFSQSAYHGPPDDDDDDNEGDSSNSVFAFAKARAEFIQERQ